MRNGFIAFIIALTSPFAKGQQVSSHVINHAGFSFSKGEFNTSASIGELAISTLSSSSGIVTQGFLQPVIYNPCTDVEIRYYPNPVMDELTIEALGCESKIESIEFYNVWGQLITQIKRAINNKIEFGSYAPGVYFMKVNLSIGRADLIKIVKVSN
jgi:Secretion system C-terminal sorting domain